jgi:signal transduction histidine kinase
MGKKIYGYLLNIFLYYQLMKKAPIQSEIEPERLAELNSYELLDTAAESDYDDFTHLASQICQTPIALISLVDENRQWFKSKIGLDATETGRDISFCGHAIQDNQIFEVCDSTKDSRFADNPLVTGQPNVIFYAGAPLVTPNGQKVGTLCVIDHKPSKLSDEQRNSLASLSRMIVTLMELRKKIKQIKYTQDLMIEQSKISVIGEMSRSMAHEINNPLFIMLGKTRLLQNKLIKGHFEQEKIVEDTDKIIAAGERISNIVKSLQIFTNQTKSTWTEPIEIMQFISSVVDLISPLLVKDQILLNIENTSNALLKINCAQIAGAINHLLLNSRDACRELSDKWIKIKIIDNINSVEIYVIDSGNGINKQIQNKIFQPFFTTKEVGQGLGLGLSVAEGAVRANGGSIQYLANEKNTTFQISIPKFQDL